MKKEYRLQGEVWLYPGENTSWHFFSLDRKTSADIKERHGKRARGFGSLPVTATLGKTTWETSIFSDKKSGTYLLPLKELVRREENIRVGDRVRCMLSIR